jgi:hypothetical protein
VILAFSALLGGVFTISPKSSEQSSPSPSATPISSTSAQCCDNEECDPRTTGKTLTFEGEEYGLLKSSVRLSETVLHLWDTGVLAPGADGGPIIVNATSKTDYKGKVCPNGGGVGLDQLNSPVNECTVIPDDQLIYVCRQGCFTPEEFFCKPDPGAEEYCYGTRENTIYDVYFRLRDYPDPGVPDVVTQCAGSGQPAVGSKRIVMPSPGIGQNLQLKSFKIETVLAGESSWVSPFCKPAIYLYPTQEMEVNVKVKAVGLSSTLPQYPLSGWTVMARPDGKLSYQNSSLDYLYYESKIPDKLLEEPTEGYVVESGKLPNFLNKLLLELGLNQKEKTDFISYWQKVLPESNFYFIGIMSEGSLNKIADLDITPAPTSEIRVTLLFKTLNEPISINPPSIESVSRQGFTVVEWGGIFKAREGEEFSCLM